MSDDNGNGDDKPEDYKVGYSKPPRHTQFKKGRSGNPSGRRRKPKNAEIDVGKLVAESLGKRRRITVDGVETERTTAEIVIDRMVLGFATGRNSSPKHLIELMHLAESYRQKTCPTDPVDHRAAVHAKLALMHERIRQARNEDRARQGLPPLPDDE